MTEPKLKVNPYVLTSGPGFLLGHRISSSQLNIVQSGSLLLEKFLGPFSLGSGLLLDFHYLFVPYPSFYPTRVWRLHKPISPSICSPKICRSQENWGRISYNPQPSKSTPFNCETLLVLCGVSRLCMIFWRLYSNHVVPGPTLEFVILF